MKKAIVALLDRLGVKGMWSQKDPEVIVQEWDRTMSWLTSRLIFVDSMISEFGASTSIKTFSDTVMVTITVEQDVDPTGLLPSMGDILMQPFVKCMYDGIFLRGAIGIGDFHEEGDVFIGPAIDQAAELYEKAELLGVIVSPKMYFGYLRTEEKIGSIFRQFVPHEVPMNSGGKLKTMALNWPLWAAEAATDYLAEKGMPKSLEPKGLMLEAFAGQHTSIRAAKKMTNTLEFFDKHYVKPTRPRRD